MIKYRDIKRYLYQLTEGYRLKLDDILPDDVAIDTGYIVFFGGDGVIPAITIHKGYAWDGPSGPPKWWIKLLWGKWKKAYLKKCLRASLVHDALCQLINNGILDGAIWGDYADRLLERILIEDGMSEWWAAKWYWTVKKWREVHTK